MRTVQFTGVKVFSATTARERDALGDRVTQWLEDNDVDVVDHLVRQSSDHEFHCVTIVLFYVD
jgi:hypothetical protein